MNKRLIFGKLILVGICFISCSKSKDSSNPPPNPGAVPVTLKSILLNNVPYSDPVYNVGGQPVFKMRFSQPIAHSSVPTSISLTGAGTIDLQTSYESNDSVPLFGPRQPCPI
jgi:hypothetical protein